jgi:protein SCO1/2
MTFRKTIAVLFLLLALVLSGCGASHTYTGTTVEPPMEVPTFTLLDSSGRPFELAGQDGVITLVFFGYTNCPDICPMTLGRLKQATAELGEQESQRVRVIFVTVDPERDTPEVVGRYVHGFDPSWIALTGDPETLAQARQAYGVFGEPEGGHEGHADYKVVHTDRIFVLTGDGTVPLIFQADTPPDKLTADVRALLRG